MSFALGLAIFGGALAVGLRTYLAASVDQTREIRTRIALESAAATVLGELAAGGRLAAEAERILSGDGQQVLVMLPGMKVDLASDPPDAVAEGTREVGLDIDPIFSAAAGGLALVSAHHRLSATQEDCLRRVFTYGRGGAPRLEVGGLEDPEVRAGDQVDLRVYAKGELGHVLWLRARFTGGETGWRIHDYRRLNGVETCP
ncbi:MAG: hypothetical protein QME55_02090 [Brevundimonas sp.]|uniref:hypothetical protein n=1 Tax=Brevundimonas sp. TaxID=1871086 RepID=UPI00260DBA5F|nr:hypothetical protein [Brevundimonas sp.]MDI6623496.1 hypothetical protein [Brevundimonas sp.]MDQ7812063.1 hypothetical protein [Brevundimonas sp.]